MFTLIEPFKFAHLDDKPDLGCANLIASLKEANVKNRLILGQTRFFHDFLLNPKEIIDLTFKLSKNEQSKLGLEKLKMMIQENGEKSFRNILRRYHYQIIKKDFNFFFNPFNVEAVSYLLTSYFEILKYYSLQKENLEIVEKTFQLIKSTKPDFIGFSLWYLDPFTNLIRKRIKEELDIPIIGGGALIPKLNQKNIDKFMLNQNFDYLCIGEGELTLPFLCKNKKIENIPNLIHLKNKKISINRLKYYDFEKSSSPDFDQFDLKKYFNPFVQLPIQISRGCAWGKCVFCDHHSIYKNKYRFIPIKDFINSLLYLSKKYKKKYFSFHDEFVPASIIKKFYNSLLKQKILDLRFDAYVRFESSFLKKNVFSDMYKAGFRSLSWGLESGSQKVLNLMNKGINLKNVKKILEASNKSKIKNICWVMVGFPGETFTDFRKTIDFLENNKKNIDSILVSRFFLHFNAPMAKNPKRWKIKINKKDKITNLIEFEYNNKPLQLRRYENVLFLIKNQICDFTSDFYKCSIPDNTQRTLIYSLAIIDPKNLLKSYKSFYDFHSIVLGKLYSKDNQLFLNVINLKKSHYLNSEEKRIEKINDLEKFIYSLTLKNLSIKEIINRLMNSKKQNFELSKKAVKGFFTKMLKTNSVLFYKKLYD